MPLHLPVSIEDAMTMLDSRIPLTYSERKMIVEGLWDLAFSEGAKQGREAGTEATQEYTDPTTQIRERLMKKAAERGIYPANPVQH